MTRRWFALVSALVLVAAQVTGALAATAPAAGTQRTAADAPVERELQGKLERGELSRFIVEFAAKADLRPAAKEKTKAAKGGAVRAALVRTANASQADARALVARERGVRASTHWLTNVLVVEGSGARAARLVDRLARLPGVSSVRAERIYPLVEPIQSRRAVTPTAEGDGIAPEWGVAKVRAPEAWAGGITGAGVVVANVDTGVDYLHDALVNQYRGSLGAGAFDHDYAWFDPTGICDGSPCDNAQHGTHTMGTMVGGDGEGPYEPDTGVAPGATWIAAKGCEDFGCSETALLASGEWLIAPTRQDGSEPDPTKAPDIINNSWGAGPGDLFYLETVQAWRAAGIIPVFSSGNPGPDCGQGGSPGDFAEVISAGATDADDLIAEFSGRGPSGFKDINPDVSAPGVDVVSTIPGGGFAAFSGTSMAAPHVAGSLALMLQADTALIGEFTSATNFLKQTAVDRIDDQCGGAADGDPNNVYGEGRIDAAAAVALVATGGTLAGTITDADTAAPIGGARVIVSDGSREFPTTTAADGTYGIFLAEGTYTVAVEAFGYNGALVGGVEIVTDETTPLDVSLVPLPRFTVNGVVAAAEDGSPIEDAKVTVLGTPVTPVLTNPNGFYEIELPIGMYTLRFTANGCTDAAEHEISSSTEGEVVEQNASLARKLDDFGHGCRPIPFEWVDAEAQTALWGDEIGGRLKLPFAFPFYGETYTEVWLAENGYVNFLGFDAGNFIPSEIPSGSTPNAAVYPLWQDLWIIEGSIDHATIEVGGKRAFVIEYGVEIFGTSTAVDVEMKLWEDGTIDLLYGDNPSQADGRLATVGIENAAGNDALQIAFLESILEDSSALRIETFPTGSVTGTVTDTNDGLPVAGATVRAQPGGRSVTTAADGTYDLRLLAGTYAITISADGYVAETTPVVTVTVGTATVIDAALDAPTAAVEPTALAATVGFGETASLDLTLSNDGSAPLTWEAKERDLGSSSPIPLAQRGIKARAEAAWRAQVLPRDVTISPIQAQALADLPIVVSDPADDSSGGQEIVAIRGFSDGTSTNLGIEFAPGTNIEQSGGFFFLDTDQDPATGFPPADFFGLPTQDIGFDYWAELFSIAGSDPVVPIFSAETFELVAEVPVEKTANGFSWSIPLEALGGDDGVIDVAMVGGFTGPEDWAPDEGHGTVETFTDLPWLTVVPSAGTTPEGTSTVLDVTLGTADLAPGTHEAELVLLTDAPRTRLLTVPVTLTVELPGNFGAATGTITDAHSGEPLAGASVILHGEFPAGTARDFPTVSAADGTFSIVGPAGTWPADVSLDGYESTSIEVTIVVGASTPGADAALHRDAPHITVDPGSVVFILEPDETGSQTVTVGNVDGHAPLDIEIGEVDLGGGPGAGAEIGSTLVRTRVAGADPGARTTRDVFSDARGRVPVPMVEGDVLAAWPAVGIDLPWGVGYTGSVWISDPLENGDLCGSACVNARYATDGTPESQVPADWVADWPADMAADPGRGWIWQVNVGGDNGIHAWDPATGDETAVITGSPWDGTSQRGLAYDGNADVFYIGGWNEGVIYRVAGPSHTTPGETLSSCSPEDPSISGLAWNPSFAMLWVATNSETDTIYLVDPITCETSMALAHPDGGGFGGAGLEMDVVGNLWATGQNSSQVYLIESGLPNFSDIPWLTIDPLAATIAEGDSLSLALGADATGLEPGVYRGIVVVLSNDPSASTVQVPVTLVVPTYRQGVNAGGGAFTASDGVAYAADQAFAPGGFGYVGASSVRSANRPIGGTDDDALYQDLRLGMTGYRFAVPNGTYRVDARFAELQVRRAGGRVFSVALEGAVVEANLDVYAAAGGRDIALDRVWVVEVTDGVLDLTFAAQRGDAPIVNAVVVTELPPGAPQP